MEMVYVKGRQILDAAIEGAKRGYNRTTDNYSNYEDILNECFNKLVKSIGNRAQRRSVIRGTKGDWRNAYLPLGLALKHGHIAGKPSEVHARVYLGTNMGAVFDIPMCYWEVFVAESKKIGH